MDSKEDSKVFNVWYKIRAHLTRTQHVNPLHKVLYKPLTQLCANFMQIRGNPLIPIPFALGSIKPVLSWIRKKIHTISLDLVICCIRFLLFRFCVNFCFLARNGCCLSFSYLRLHFFWQSTHWLLFLLLLRMYRPVGQYSSIIPSQIWRPDTSCIADKRTWRHEIREIFVW